MSWTGKYTDIPIFCTLRSPYCSLLSCMTGRPVMLSDEAIDTDLPADVVSDAFFSFPGIDCIDLFCRMDCLLLAGCARMFS